MPVDTKVKRIRINEQNVRPVDTKVRRIRISEQYLKSDKEKVKKQNKRYPAYRSSMIIDIEIENF